VWRGAAAAGFVTIISGSQEQNVTFA